MKLNRGIITIMNILTIAGLVASGFVSIFFINKESIDKVDEKVIKIDSRVTVLETKELVREENFQTMELFNENMASILEAINK